MPSTILSDNGVSSGSAGLKTTAASDGALALQTTTAGGTATTAVTIGTNQAVTVANTGTGVTFSSSGGSGLRVYGASGTNQWDMYLNGANLRYSDNTGGGRIVIDGTASVGSTFGVGGATPSASGAGITFPATQSASSDANTLDDYEEGTWTVSDASGAGLSITNNFAFYTKVGDLVFACCDIVYPSTANGNNAAFSLPFTGSRYSNGYVGYSNYTTSAITLESVTNSAVMNIQNATYGAVSNASFSGKRLIATFVYKAL